VNEILFCDKCKHKLCVRNSEGMLYIDGLIVKAVHGWCERCGAPFHYSITDLGLQRIIARHDKWSKEESC
jgi:hypothetical protein